MVQPQFEEGESKYKLIALKRRIEQDYREERAQLEQQHLFSRELEIEKVVRKKIEVE